MVCQAAAYTTFSTLYDLMYAVPGLRIQNRMKLGFQIKGRTLRMFEGRILRIFGPKEGEVTGGWKDTA